MPDQHTKYFNEYYGQLVGGTIKSFRLIKDEYDKYMDPWPVFVIEMEGGTRLRVQLSQDEEGNGPGFLFIEEEEEEK